MQSNLHLLSKLEVEIGIHIDINDSFISSICIFYIGYENIKQAFPINKIS